MKKDGIETAALILFAKNGYEGTSVTQIAQEVGIKKQSLYSHYQSKDDLFLKVLMKAKTRELAFYREHLEKKLTVKPYVWLRWLLVEIKELYESDEEFKFWIRMSYYPPLHLFDCVECEFLKNLAEVDLLIDDMFQEWIDYKVIPFQDAKTLSLAFTGIIDTIVTELVYGSKDERIKQKIEALMAIFWRGLCNTEEIYE